MRNLRLARHGFDILVVIFFLSLISTAVFSDQMATVSLSEMMHAPSAKHLLGTDNLGRDLAQRLGNAVMGAILPLWSCVCLASIVGLFLALSHILIVHRLAWSPWDLLIRTITSGVAAIPVGVSAFLAAAWFGQAGLEPVFWTLLIFFSVRIFLQTMNLYTRDHLLGYWQAHESMGGGLESRIWNYGVKQQWKGDLWDQTRFHLTACIAIESAISYLGFGLQEPQASFGNMLASHFDSYLHGQWLHLIIIVISITLVSFLPLSLERLVVAATRADRQTMP